MSLTTTKLLLTITLILWSLTLLRSITIMISGKEIFKKSARDEKSSMYPIVNLFTMLEIADISTYFGILFFVPIANFIVLCAMSYKLGSVFNTSFIYKLGLVILPIVFYNKLGKSDKQYKLRDEDYFKALDNIRETNASLMTEDESKPTLVIEDKDENNVSVDSIFKSKVDVVEAASPYKAAKIDLIGMEKLQRNEEEINKNN